MLIYYVEKCIATQPCRRQSQTQHTEYLFQQFWSPTLNCSDFLES